MAETSRDNIELPANLQNKLEELPKTYIGAYKLLLEHDKGRFLRHVLSSSLILERVTTSNLLSNFTHLRPYSLHSLARISDQMGVPLSPLGLITFKPGAVLKIQEKLSRSYQAEHPTASGICFYTHYNDTKLPLWVAESNSSNQVTSDIYAKYIKERGEKFVLREVYNPHKDLNESAEHGSDGYEEHTITTYSNPEAKLNFPDETKGVNKEDIYEYLIYTSAHEALHATLAYLNPSFFISNHFSNRVINEGLAWQAGYLSGIYGDLSIDSILRNYYFEDELKDPVNATMYEQIWKIFRDIYGSAVDYERLKYMNSLAIVCETAVDFINPSAEILKRQEKVRTLLDVANMHYQKISKLNISDN